MPNGSQKSKKRSYRRKRSYKKRRGVFRLQRQMPVGFPKTNMVKLRYVDSVQLNAIAGVIDTYVFRANSIFDPNFTGIGHKPNGMDQWGNFYNHYVVVGSKIKVTWATTSVTTTGGLSVRGVFLSDDTTYSTSLTDLLEQSQSRRSTALPSTTKPTVTVKGYSAKKFFNITNITDNWSRLGANFGVNPQEIAFFVLYYGNANASVDPIAVTALVEIDYICVFSEPKELPQS